MAVDDAGNALEYNGSSWSTPKRIDSGNHLWSVSCPVSSFCAAVDSAGNALRYNGSSWSHPQRIDSSSLTSISCSSVSFCAAVDGSGSALTYRASPTTAQIKGQLLEEITPRGQSARIAALLKAGAYTLAFNALSAGRAMVDWYYLPAGAHLGAGKPKPVLVASGSRTFSGSGTARLELGLTKAGRKLLGRAKSDHVKRLKLTANASFKAPGRATVLAEKIFTLTR